MNLEKNKEILSPCMEIDELIFSKELRNIALKEKEINTFLAKEKIYTVNFSELLKKWIWAKYK